MNTNIGSISAMVCCLAAANLFSPPLFAQGTLAMSSMISGGGGCADCVTDSIQLSFGMVYRRGAPDVALFDSLALRTNDVNRLLVFTPAQGEGFNSFVRILTNGVSDNISVNLSLGGGGGGLTTTEQRFFCPLPSGGNGVDFQGYQIDNIALQVEEVTFTYPGEYETWFTFRGRILVNSEPLPTNALAILLPPASQNAGPGSTVDLAVLAVGEPPLGYQWFFNQTQAVPGASGCSLLLTNVQPAQAGAYSVVVTNPQGSVTSSIAILNVIDPCINNLPAKWGVPLGGSTAFYADAAGTPPFLYQWLKNGSLLNDGGILSGTHTYNLQLSSVSSSDAGSYAVVVSNSRGSITGLVANLVVQDPFISTQPNSCHVHVGGTVQLTGSGGGSPPLSYQWLKDNVSLSDGGTVSGARSSMLTLSGVGPADSGDYSFVVWNTVGSAPSMAVTLTVDDPFIAVQPADLVLNPEGSARFEVFAGGTPPLSYQWFKDGGALSDGEGISGTQTPALMLTQVTGADVGQYWVVVSNASGSVSSATAMLILNSTVYSILHTFTGTEGAFPHAGLLLSGQTLYGTAGEGGPYGNNGTVFKLKTDGSGFTGIKALAGGNEGTGPSGAIALSGATLYGTAYMGGAYNYGVVYRLNTNGSGYTVLRSFSTSDAEPAGVTLFENNLYGATGLTPVLFKIGADGSQYSILKRFLNGDGCSSGFLFLDGQLYGTGGGGSFGQGGIFKMDLDGSNFTVLKAFAGLEGKDPEAGLVWADGAFYGTMAQGGSNGCGTVFTINPDGSGLRVLKHFAGHDGNYPNSPLVLSGSNLVGTTDDGGSSGLGTIFILNTDGTGFTVLRSFSGNDGAYPVGRLVLAGSMLYGVTRAGGSANEGVVFSLSVAPLGILAVPQTQTAEAGSNVCLWVGTTDEPGWLYQWLFNETNLTGWTTNCAIVMTNVQFSQSGAYTVIESNRFGAATSSRALLNVIAPVERRPVPGLKLTGQTGNVLNVDCADSLSPAPNWTPLGSVSLISTSQYYFDVNQPLAPRRFYRGWQAGAPNVLPSLDLHIVPAITLTGNIGDSVRVDALNQFGPIDAWVTLDTVALTNTSQLYFDTSSIAQPARLWRIVPLP